MAHTIGVCSWSLRPSNPAELVDRLKQCGLNTVQIALDPIRRGEWNVPATIAVLQDAGVSIVSGMMAMHGEDYSTLETIRTTGGVRSDEHWKVNLQAAHANAQIAHRMGIGLVTFHAGFLPHRPTDPTRPMMLDRIAAIARAFNAHGVDVALETGQEAADTLLSALTDLQHLGAPVGVNFDPANMVLYDMGEPVKALQKIAPHVRQIHIKDALPAVRPGTWGKEVAVGEGSVNWTRFFEIVRASLPSVNLIIEREARQERIEDIRAARNLVQGMLAQPPGTTTA